MKLYTVYNNEQHLISFKEEEIEILEKFINCIEEYINNLGYEAKYKNKILELFVPNFTAEYVFEQLKFEYQLFEEDE